jgi:NAD(P)-dependent dehydrogenase (short-subunit alcohol dehydrogenase family)
MVTAAAEARAVSSRRFDGKVAVVTGGGTGIGLATATRLHDEGARVAIGGRNVRALEEAARSIGERVVCIGVDVTNMESIDGMFREVAGRVGLIDVLFVNAGVGRFASLVNTDEGLYDEIFATNTRGAFFTVQRALPHMNDGAAIVFNAIAPVAPAWRRPGTSAYTASKAALLSFTQTLAIELAERRIRVNAVSPGPTLTAIYEHAGVPQAVIEERRARIASAAPMKRFASADEIAAAVVFLASPEASYITGAEIRVDGGLA